MKKMKVLAILLSVVLVVSACGTGTDTEGNKGNVGNVGNSESQNSQMNNTSDVESDVNENETENQSTEIQEEEVIDVTGLESKTLYAQSNVNVRKSASTDSDKLGTLAKNDEIVAYGEAKDGWQIVAYGEGYGYVSAEYLGTEKVVVVTPQPSETIMEVGEITADQFSYPSIDASKTLVVIDAGHQGKMNREKEPVGPGSSTMKTKVAAGTSGTATGIAEYVVNLQVSLKLQAELEARGYQVVMIRTTNNINISNAQRAIVANNLGADAFIRIHCNGSDNTSITGAMTICQTSGNPYNANIYGECRSLSDNVVNNICAVTGQRNAGVWETDTMSGINWCSVPVTIVEMGFMTNAAEDQNLCNDSFQNKMVQGIANGIDAYFGR